MLTIISTMLNGNPTPDTGTAADGWPDMSAFEQRSAHEQENRRRAFTRDYGADRNVRPYLIGHA